jgi:REP element-mobilizing transposase RayT
MPRLPRDLLLDCGLSFHKVWRGHNREWNLSEPDEKRVYLHMLNEEFSKQKNPLHVVCLMSNHSHEIYSLENLREFSCFMRRHHGRYGQFFNKRHHRCGKVAQDRPKTIAIENDSHEMTTTFYVHANPLRAKIVRDAKDYRWSTHRLYAFGKRAPWMRQVRFPAWYMNLAKTREERQKKYRQLFDAYLRQFGLIKQTFSIYGIGDLRWRSARRAPILEFLRQKAKAASPP